MVYSFIKYDSGEEREGVETITNRLSVATVWGDDTNSFGGIEWAYLVLT